MTQKSTSRTSSTTRLRREILSDAETVEVAEMAASEESTSLDAKTIADNEPGSRNALSPETQPSNMSCNLQFAVRFALIDRSAQEASWGYYLTPSGGVKDGSKQREEAQRDARKYR